jgi:polysaccharide export outer membrane protein
MNTPSFINIGLSSWRLMVWSSLLALVSLGFTGCATNDMPKSASIEKMHAELIILREGDNLKITFPSSPNLDTVQQIRRDGKIVMPLVGEVQAAGLTPDGLRESLVKSYATQIGSKEINVFVESSSFPVFVSGAVIHPGKILSDHPITALEAVMEAGGFDYTTADTKDVKVVRNENGKLANYKVNLHRILSGGSDANPFYMKPQDIIYVPERLELF